MARLRPQPVGLPTVVFELHERRIADAWLTQLGQGRGPLLRDPSFNAAAAVPDRSPGWSVRLPATAPLEPGWSVRGTMPYVPASVLSPQPGASVPPRDSGTSVADEWKSLGFNCGGALLAWIGVAGAGAATPVTGGVSGIGAVVLYGGAVAASGQCIASVYRVHNATTGHEAVNRALDANPYYKWSMIGADAIQLWGAKGALKEAWVANRALRAAGTTWGDALQRTTTASQRVLAASGMELEATQIGSKVLSRLARQKLVDGAAAVLGVYASYDGGVIHELIVWVAEERK